MWVVYPARRLAAVHTPDLAVRHLGEGDHLDGGDVVPGLHLPVADLFT